MMRPKTWSFSMIQLSSVFMRAPRFPLGQILATPGALDALGQCHQNPLAFLARHSAGDWGDLSDGDRELNEQAVLDGSRIFSAYRTKNGTKLWVITDATDENGQRSVTTILLPEEY
jgi:hypothetical protein